MSSAGAIGGGIQAGAGVLQFVEGSNTDRAIRLQAETEARQFENNASLLGLSRLTIQDRLRDDKKLLQRKNRQLKGAQRSIAAAQGVELSSDTFLDIQESTQQLSDEDMVILEANALTDDLELQVAQNSMLLQADFTRLAGAEKGRQARVASMAQGISNIAQGVSRVGTYFHNNPSALNYVNQSINSAGAAIRGKFSSATSNNKIGDLPERSNIGHITGRNETNRFSGGSIRPRRLVPFVE